MASRSAGTRIGPDDVLRHVRTLPKRFRADAVNGLAAEWELRVGDRPYTISVTGHRCEVSEGPAPGPDTIITTEPSTWLQMDEGLITGGQAFMDRRLTATGNLDLAVRDRKSTRLNSSH